MQVASMHMNLFANLEEVTSMLAASRRLSHDEQDRSAIADVVSGLECAWAAGDRQTWASFFAEDADFTTWFGLYVRGGEAIADVYQEIFDAFYKSSKLRLHVRHLRFLRPDVAVAQFEGTIVGSGEQPRAYPRFVPVAIMTKEDGRWRVAVFHNTKDTADEQLGMAAR
jgi:uncharacterized protein (TIGR02246 family)